MARSVFPYLTTAVAIAAAVAAATSHSLAPTPSFGFLPEPYSTRVSILFELR
jgi:hypothetical protein